MNNKMYEKGIQAQVCYEDLLDKLGEEAVNMIFRIFKAAVEINRRNQRLKRVRQNGRSVAPAGTCKLVLQLLFWHLMLFLPRNLGK